jgi:hypothetical protein
MLGKCSTPLSDFVCGVGDQTQHLTYAESPSSPSCAPTTKLWSPIHCCLSLISRGPQQVAQTGLEFLGSNDPSCLRLLSAGTIGSNHQAQSYFNGKERRGDL